MFRSIPSVALGAMLLVGSASVGAAQDATPAAGGASPETAVVLRDVDGNEVGSARFAEGPGGAVTVAFEVEGLTPGAHGMHVHETGLCEPSGDEPFASAGAHFNPTGVGHGEPPGMFGAPATPPDAGSRDVQAFATPDGGVGTPDILATAPVVGSPEAAGGHAGDLGNITADDAGSAVGSITTDRFTLSAGPATLADEDGSALIVHADPDDLATDPGGDSGGRIVCGVVFPPAGGAAATPTS